MEDCDRAVVPIWISCFVKKMKSLLKLDCVVTVKNVYNSMKQYHRVLSESQILLESRFAIEVAEYKPDMYNAKQCMALGKRCMLSQTGMIKKECPMENIQGQFACIRVRLRQGLQEIQKMRKESERAVQVLFAMIKFEMNLLERLLKTTSNLSDDDDVIESKKRKRTEDDTEMNKRHKTGQKVPSREMTHTKGQKASKYESDDDIMEITHTKGQKASQHESDDDIMEITQTKGQKASKYKGDHKITETTRGNRKNRNDESDDDIEEINTNKRSRINI